MKFAYFVRPHLGGTYSVFANLRAGLMNHGVDLRWLHVPSPGDDVSLADQWALDCGSFVHSDHGDPDGACAAKLMTILKRERFDGVFINVLAEPLQMNLVRYLPASVLRMMIVHTITPATYSAAVAIRDHVHATVAVCKRARDDLVDRHSFSSQRTFIIDNAVDIDTMCAVDRSPATGTGLRLLSLGRVEDASKGVLWLPRILGSLSQAATLTVAGIGPDLPELAKRLAQSGCQANLLGAVPKNDVGRLLAEHDVLVMPSRFEGSPLTLMEAMAAGCVPVVSRIAGVTDSIVRHDVTGLLFPIGDWREAARHIRHLGERPDRLASMSVAARAAARKGFGIDTMAKSYARLLADLQRSPPPIAAPLPLDQWTLPAGFRPGLRTYLPQPVKNWLRMASERFHQQEMVD